MITSIDHLVVRVDDLNQAIADYTTLGFTVVPGGEHADGITHNALIILADGIYIELIGFKQSATDHRWWREGAHSEGLIDFALLPGAIEQDILAATKHGVLISGPHPGGRMRPDGQQIEWKSAWTDTPDLPFLCGDVTPRGLRVPEGMMRRHANGTKGLADITILVHDLYTSIVRYRALLGVADGEQRVMSSGAALQPTVEQWHIAGLGFSFARFRLGRSSITLAAPANLVRNGLAGDILHDHLETWGAGPFAFALCVEQSKSTSLLDTSLTHGTRIEMVPEKPS